MVRETSTQIEPTSKEATNLAVESSHGANEEMNSTPIEIESRIQNTPVVKELDFSSAEDEFTTVHYPSAVDELSTTTLQYVYYIVTCI